MSEQKESSIQECEKLTKCVVWPKFNTDSKFVWIKAYCQGPKQSMCARKLRAAKGLGVPDDLLPNGENL